MKRWCRKGGIGIEGTIGRGHENIERMVKTLDLTS
jgi:hypothetical protein